MSEEDSAEKEHEASQRRLDQAREKGEIPRSPDLVTAAAQVGMLLAIGVSGATALRKGGEAGMMFLAQADRLAVGVFAGGAGGGPLPGQIMAMVLPSLAFFIGPLLLVLIMLTATRAWVFAPTKIAFRLSRISPLSNAAQKFGRAGLFEFGKSAVKLVIVSLALGYFLLSRLPEVMGIQQVPAAPGFVVTLQLIRDFLVLVVVLSIVIGGLDGLWQWLEHRRRNRMSRQEVIDESRDSEGDPHQKAARRQRAQEIATNRMLLDVAKADVVIVNPTHFAVALQWKRDSGGAPVCLAKGVDEIAARIRDRARENGVPLHSDPPTARALHATVEIGQQIRPDQYRAVAAAIRFAEAMRLKAKQRGRG